MKDFNPQIQTLSSNKPHLGAPCSNFQNKDNILNIVKKIRHITFRGTVVKIIADFWREKIKPEDNGMTFWSAKGKNNCQSRILFPAKLK